MLFASRKGIGGNTGRTKQKRPVSATIRRDKTGNNAGQSAKLRPQTATGRRGSAGDVQALRRTLLGLLKELKLNSEDSYAHWVPPGGEGEVAQLNQNISSLLQVRTLVLGIIKKIEAGATSVAADIDAWRAALPSKEPRKFFWKGQEYGAPPPPPPSPPPPAPALLQPRDEAALQQADEDRLRAQHLNTILIQSWYRGTIGRRRAVYMKMRVQAAVKIQAFTRMRLGRKKAVWWRDTNRVAVTIQRHWRGHRDRRMLSRHGKAVNSAVKIQAVWRGYATRAAYSVLTLEKAVVRHTTGCIVKCWRSYKWRQRSKVYTHRKRAATKISSLFKGFLARRDFRNIKLQKHCYDISRSRATVSPSLSSEDRPPLPSPVSELGDMFSITSKGKEKGPFVPSKILYTASFTEQIDEGEWLVLPPAPEESRPQPHPAPSSPHSEAPFQNAGLWRPVVASASPLPSKHAEPVEIQEVVSCEVDRSSFAANIQRWYRCCRARRRSKELRTKRQIAVLNTEAAERRQHAAQIIQRAHRRHRSWIHTRSMACLAIQQWWRGVGDTRCRPHHHEDLMIEEEFETHWVRKDAVLRIERKWRAVLWRRVQEAAWIDAVLASEEKLHQVKAIQEWWRLVIKIESSAVRRANFLERIDILKKKKSIENDAVTVIQAVWKGCMHRRRNQSMMAKCHAVRVRAELRIDAAVAIQGLWRKHYFRKALRSKQSARRNHLKAIRDSEELTENIIRIQALMRGHLARKSHALHKLMQDHIQKTAAILIQKTTRGHLTRLRYTRYKQHTAEAHAAYLASLKDSLLEGWPSDFPYPLDCKD